MKTSSFPKVIVLDFDGTLVDSFPVLNEAYKQLNVKLGALDLFQNRMRYLKYLGDQKWKALYRFFSRPLECRLLAKQIYVRQARLFDGMAEMLSGLVVRRDVQLFILSQNFTPEPTDTIQQVLARNNVRHIDKIEIHTVPPRVSKSNFLSELIHEKGIGKDSIFVAGDEWSDFQSFQKVGLIHKAIVSYGYDSLQKLFRKNISDQYILKTPRALIQRICDFVEKE